MPKYLDPKADVVFKRVFGSHPPLLKSFLAEQAAYSIGELQAYDDYWDQVSREKTLLSAKYREGKAEGLAEGKAEGIAEGEVRGEAKMLLNIMQLKFKTVPKELKSAIMQMNTDELSALSQKILTARTIEDISVRN
jgi:flagellar biosynthesis/type III secretory pathway protein FliH